MRKVMLGASTETRRKFHVNQNERLMKTLLPSDALHINKQQLSIMIFTHFHSYLTQFSPSVEIVFPFYSLSLKILFSRPISTRWELLLSINPQPHNAWSLSIKLENYSDENRWKMLAKSSGVGWDRNFGRNIENNSIKNSSSERARQGDSFAIYFRAQTIFLPNRNKRAN